MGRGCGADAHVSHTYVALHREPKSGTDWHEARGGSHFLGRALREQGHEVRIIPAQYVKPYVKTNKKVLGTAAEYKVSEVAARNAGVILKIDRQRLAGLLKKSES